MESLGQLTAGTATAAAVALILVGAVSVVVLPPLARAKRRAGRMLGSRAQRGDGTLSGVGATTALLAVAGLLANRTFGWWWADPRAALIVAVVAGVEARAVFARAP